MHFRPVHPPHGGLSYQSKADRQFHPETQVRPPWRRLFFETTGHFEKDGHLVAGDTGQVLRLPGQLQRLVRSESISLQKVVNNPTVFQPSFALPLQRGNIPAEGRSETSGDACVKSSHRQKRLQDYGTRLTSKELLASAYQGLSDIISEHPSFYLIPGLVKLFDLSAFPFIHQIKDDTVTKENPIDRPNRLDVLLGRGGTTNYHFGNRIFRQLVALYRPTYCVLPKGRKAELAWNLTCYVRWQGGRFLTHSTTTDKDDDAWYECGNERAQQKVAQGLREGTSGMVQEAIKMHLESV